MTRRQTEEAAEKWLEDNSETILTHYGIEYFAHVESEETTSEDHNHEECVSGYWNVIVDEYTYSRIETGLKTKGFDSFFTDLAKKDGWDYPYLEMSTQDNNRIFFEISRYYTP